MTDLKGIRGTSPFNDPSVNHTDFNSSGHCDTFAVSKYFVFTLSALYSLVFLVGLLLNCVTMKFYFCQGQQRVSNSMMVYMKNLAVADFLFCLCLPFTIVNYVSKSITIRLSFCNFGSPIFYLNMYASIMFMGYIAANRYLKIVHPSQTHVLQTVRSAHIISVVTWVFLLATVITYITLSLLTPKHPLPVSTRCEELLSAQLLVLYKIIVVFSSIIFLFVLTSLVFFYYGASRRVLEAQQTQPASHSNKLVQSRKNMLVLVIVFCVCFIPYHLVRFLYAFLWRRCSVSEVFYHLKELSIIISSLNVCLDPLVYFFLSKTLRAQLINLMRVSNRHTKKQSTETQSSPGHVNIIDITSVTSHPFRQ